MNDLVILQQKNKELLEKLLCKAMGAATYECFDNTMANYMNSFDPISNKDVRSLNRENGLNIPHGKLNENDDCVKMKADLFNYVSRAYIDYLSHKIWSELSNYSYHNGVPLYLVQLGHGSEWPKANCVHYRENYDIEEMLDDYQPAKIVFCPYRPQDYLFGQSTIGIYFLNEKNHFISKMIIRFFDERTAPKGCTKLRIPKTVSQFKALI